MGEDPMADVLDVIIGYSEAGFYVEWFRWSDEHVVRWYGGSRIACEARASLPAPSEGWRPLLEGWTTDAATATGMYDGW